MSDDQGPPHNGHVPPFDESELARWVDDDGKARSEVDKWPNEDALRDQKTKNDILILKCFGYVLVVVLLVFALIFLFGVVIWSWHYIAPDCWGWLSKEQLSKIQSVIFSGSLGGVVTLVAQKQLSK